VSVHIEKIASSEATQEADHHEEPHGTLFRLHGFFVLKNAEFSVEDHMANSSQFVFQRHIEFPSFSAIVELYGDIKFLSIFDQAVVLTHFMQTTSFIA